jgi:mono/diheme cytochrome c family protein
MKLIKSVLMALPLIAVTTLILSFSYQQARPMAVFKAPASADATTNPLKGDATATLAGQKLYKQQCAACHGDRGKGDGAAAAALSKPPANHTSATVQKLSDGALFWMLTNGNSPMPSYKYMTETQRWQLINFIRTLAGH